LSVIPAVLNSPVNKIVSGIIQIPGALPLPPVHSFKRLKKVQGSTFKGKQKQRTEERDGKQYLLTTIIKSPFTKNKVLPACADGRQVTGEISSMIDIQSSCYHYKMHVNQLNSKRKPTERLSLTISVWYTL